MAKTGASADDADDLAFGAQRRVYFLAPQRASHHASNTALWTKTSCVCDRSSAQPVTLIPNRRPL
jgi:hypothetical protein